VVASFGIVLNHCSIWGNWTFKPAPLTLLRKPCPDQPDDTKPRNSQGDKANLFSYFSDTATGYRFRLSTWQNKHYRPWEAGPALDEEPLGGVFRLTVSRTRNGLAKLTSAVCVAPVPDELAYPQTLECHHASQPPVEPLSKGFFWPSGAGSLKERAGNV
jgi:hypothetical protein